MWSFLRSKFESLMCPLIRPLRVIFKFIGYQSFRRWLRINKVYFWAELRANVNNLAGAFGAKPQNFHSVFTCSFDVNRIKKDPFPRPYQRIINLFTYQVGQSWFLILKRNYFAASGVWPSFLLAVSTIYRWVHHNTR